MLSDSSDYQSMVGTDKLLGSEFAAVTRTNENDYHLDSYSHLVYIVRYSAQSIDELIDLYQSEIDLCH